MGALTVLGCDVDQPGPPTYPVFSSNPRLADAGPDAADADAATPPPQAVTLPSGRWGLFGFEDPVGIDFGYHIGCFAGLPDPRDQYELDECTLIEEMQFDGQRLQFAFMAMQYRYAADVMVSADGTRMAGRFHGVSAWSGPHTAWLPVDDHEIWLKYHGDQAMSDALRYRAGGFTLRLEQGPVPGVFEPDVEYNLWLSVQGYGPYLAGDLGAFWGDEMQWNEEDGILSLGPVPATDPFLAVSLTIDFSRGDTVWVVATWPSGFSSTFAAVRR